MKEGTENNPLRSKIPPTRLSHNSLPLPWREGIKGRGKDKWSTSFYSSPPPLPSPIKGEGEIYPLSKGATKGLSFSGGGHLPPFLKGIEGDFHDESPISQLIWK